MEDQLHQLCFAEAAEIAPVPAGGPPPSRFVLLRYGRNVYTQDGKRSHFDFTPEDAARIIADFGERGKDLVVDYDHQSVCSGVRAPAAGWITALAAGGDALVAEVNWTEEGAAALSGRQYRYHSPVIVFGRGRPCALHSVALTNHPALHRYAPLVAHDTATQEKGNMDEKLEKLAGILDVTVPLDDCAGGGAQQEDAAMEAIGQRIAQLTSSAREMAEFLQLHGAATLADVTGMIRGMVPASEKAELERRLNGVEAEKAVAQAFADGKLVEAQREWADGYARRDLAAFRAFTDAAPAVVPLGDKPDCRPLKSGRETLSEEERKILRNLGVSEEKFLKHRKELEGKEEE